MRQPFIAAACLGLVALAGCDVTKRFVITSVPDGATVVIDKQQLGRTTPLDHTLRFSKRDGRWDTHLVHVFKPGYREDSWVVEHGDAPTLMFFLVPERPE